MGNSNAKQNKAMHNTDVFMCGVIVCAAWGLSYFMNALRFLTCHFDLILEHVDGEKKLLL